jgi:hypothetical protein
MHIITCATHNEGYFDILKKSCKKNGHKLKVLGWKQGKNWKGNISKFKYIIEYLKKIDPNEIILVVDAFDVMVLANSKEIEQKFKKMNKKFLCGAEKIDNFTKKIVEERFNKLTKIPYKKTPNGYDYLCSGTIISYAGYALKIYEKCLENNKGEESDQVALVKIYLTSNLIDIDWKNELFFTSNAFNFGKLGHMDFFNPRQYEDIYFFKNRIYNKDTNSFPVVIHLTWNGDLCEKFAKKLGYKCKEKMFSNKYLIKKNYYHLKHSKVIMAIIYTLFILIILSILSGIWFGIKIIKK